jgi:hypothetical protein
MFRWRAYRADGKLMNGHTHGAFRLNLAIRDAQDYLRRHPADGRYIQITTRANVLILTLRQTNEARDPLRSY